MFGINFDNLIKYLLPPRLRRGKIISYIMVAISPVVTVHNFFTQWVIDKLYEKDFNGQVISLERLLNDQFDSVLRRIFIENTIENNIFLYNDSASNLELEKAFIYLDAAALPNDVWVLIQDGSVLLRSFSVHVPDDTIIPDNEVSFFVNKYKLAGKDYEIVHETL